MWSAIKSRLSGAWSDAHQRKPGDDTPTGRPTAKSVSYQFDPPQQDETSPAQPAPPARLSTTVQGKTTTQYRRKKAPDASVSRDGMSMRTTTTGGAQTPPSLAREQTFILDSTPDFPPPRGATVLHTPASEESTPSAPPPPRIAPFGRRSGGSGSAVPPRDTVGVAATRPVGERLLADRTSNRMVYDLVLYKEVAATARVAVVDALAKSVGMVSHLLQLYVRSIVFRVVPRPKGVIKAIDEGGPHPMPLDFDEDDRKTIQSIFTGSGAEKLVDQGTFVLTRANLKTLEGNEWLNDQVINFYIYLQEQCFSDILSLGSFFFTKLDPQSKRYAYSDVSRWTRKKSVFGARLVFVPVCRRSHWTLAVVNVTEQRLEYYDSLGGKGEDVLDKIATFLDDEFENKKGRSPAVSHHQWPRRTPGRDGPQQRNGYDCGVFVCQTAALLACGAPNLLSIKQCDMAFYRQMIAIEILKGKIVRRQTFAVQ